MAELILIALAFLAVGAAYIFGGRRGYALGLKESQAAYNAGYENGLADAKAAIRRARQSGVVSL